MILLEHKTTSQAIGVGEPYWSKLLLDTQASIYLDVARRQGLPITEIVFDVCRKPALRPKKDETPDAFATRCTESILCDLTGHYRRAPVVRLDKDHEDALLDLISATRTIRAYRKAGVWPKNPDGCVRYFRPCEYLPVCTHTGNLDDAEKFETREPAGKTIAISKSSLETFRRCPKEFYYSKILGRRPRASSDALRIGTGFHEALEVWFKTKDLAAALAAIALDDPFEQARTAAMVCGYHAMWESVPFELVSVEAPFDFSLVRGFRVTGRFDAIVKEGKENVRPY